MDCVHWTNNRGRTNLRLIALSPLMLEGAYERVIDGKIVQFDSSFVVYRFSNLIYSVLPAQMAQSEKLSLSENLAHWFVHQIETEALLSSGLLRLLDAQSVEHNNQTL